MNFVIQHSYLIPLLPLIGACIAGFFGAKWLKGQSHWPIWAGVGISAILAITLLVGMLGHEGAEAEEPAAGQESVEGHTTAATVSETAAEAFKKTEEFGHSHKLFTWIEAGDPKNGGFTADAGFWFDPLTSVMLCVVCGIGFFITVFAAGYMKGEMGYWRFFAYLGLFIFMMTNLVMGENLIMLYLGWEGVGLCSYLLIGYYYDRPAAREAAKKAFLVNRVGDFGFGVGIMLTFYCFGTVSFFGDPANGTHGFMQMAADVITGVTHLSGGKDALVPWIPFCLMVGAFGKSAQFPLYVWLPDAMEGPTPVSALIHAATMVTAGVYMIARCSVLFVGNPAASLTIAIVGAFTAIFAATIALRQFDLKKVFAYSTVSQLGFMFAGVGLLAPVAGVFHLITHAFFKALLFLSSGVVMHAMLGHLDMRKMSGLKRVMPKTRILMLIGCLALAGFPFFSGFFSKDEIVANAQRHNTIIWVVLLITAFMTAYYTFRLYFRVFEGPLLVPSEPAEGHAHDDHSVADEHAHASASAVQTGDVAKSGVDKHLASNAHKKATDHGHGHDDHGHHNHEPMIMILPLVVLAIGALLAGYVLGPGLPGHKEPLLHFLKDSPSFRGGHAVAAYKAAESVDRTDLAANYGLAEVDHGHMAEIVGGAIALAGIALAAFLHLLDRRTGDRIPEMVPAVTRLLEAKYWVDEIYQRFIVEPLRTLGRIFFAIDRIIVDGVVWLVSFIPFVSGSVLKIVIQRGYLQGYAASMLLGVAVILLVIFL